jgi:hypothetical protein
MSFKIHWILLMNTLHIIKRTKIFLICCSGFFMTKERRTQVPLSPNTTGTCAFPQGRLHADAQGRRMCPQAWAEYSYAWNRASPRKHIPGMLLLMSCVWALACRPFLALAVNRNPSFTYWGLPPGFTGVMIREACD